ncbi:hypothetical protein [uncultured Microbacterium sp.]|nr:hypothetical protein [uncultured Microbacterium sp.]
MADLSRHLPLSNRPYTDESSVTGDWRRAVADVVAAAAHLTGDPDQLRGFLVDAKLAAEFPAASPADVAAAIRSGRRRRIAELADATRALLRLAGDREVGLDPTTSGAVALYGATRAPFDRRAVLTGSTVHATDADWSFGRGPLREATARQILAFVLELGDEPPPLTRRG